MKRDLYEEVSARIVAELERGAAPWVRPWSATAGINTPCNAVTNRPYSGCNVVLLWMARASGYQAPRFLTYKQALEPGGHVRKGERGTKVYFVKQLQVRDKNSDDESATRVIPMLREYAERMPVSDAHGVFHCPLSKVSPYPLGHSYSVWISGARAYGISHDTVGPNTLAKY